MKIIKKRPDTEYTVVLTGQEAAALCDQLEDYHFSHSGETALDHLAGVLTKALSTSACGEFA